MGPHGALRPSETGPARAVRPRYRNRFTNDPEAGNTRMGTANTNLVYRAGKLLALKEDDLPYELDPETLETRSHFDFSGAITSVSLSARQADSAAAGCRGERQGGAESGSEGRRQVTSRAPRCYAGRRGYSSR